MGRLTQLEVATGVVVDPSLVRHRRLRTTVAPLDALENVARGLLARPPCVIAFSGGRDSSALLAVFVRVARREGLADPIPVTVRFDGDTASDERAWQESVVVALDVHDWEIVKPDADLDLLGPLATEVLMRHGLLWPSPAYAMLPVIRIASGGVVVTGEGGDEVFGLWHYQRAWPRRGCRWRGRDVLGLLGGFGPSVLRELLWQRRELPYQQWLSPAARHAHAMEIAHERAVDPPIWSTYLRSVEAHRTRRLLIETYTQLSESASARYAAPLVDPSFLDALASMAPMRGLGNRTEAMSAVFEDVLPRTVLTRQSKATFGGVFWGPASRAFADEWDGRGLDVALIEPDALRDAWRADLPVYGAALPLHAAWLAMHRAQDAPLGGSSPSRDISHPRPID